VWTKRFPVGIYSFTARVTDENGAISYPTAALKVVVEMPVLFQWGFIAFNVFSLLIFILVGFGIVIAVGMYILYRLAMLRRHLSNFMVHAQGDIRTDFAAMQEEMEKHIMAIQQAKGNRALTKEEKKLLVSLKKHLTKTEAQVVASLKTVEKEM
jgi:hypothetical protein